MVEGRIFPLGGKQIAARTSHNRHNLVFKNQQDGNIEVTPQQTMFDLFGGFRIARSIYLADQIGVTDAFDNQPELPAQLAAATNTEARSLYRLLRALASVGIFSEVSDRCFALTPLATTLKSDSPDSMRYAVLTQMGYDHSLGWSNGLHSLKTGEVAFDAAAGMPVWEYYAQHPEAGQIFSQSMTNLGIPTSQAVAATYDFSQFNTIVDVGGAQGSLISTIMRSYPHLKGILFDLPEVIATVSVDEKIQPIAGNFFESVPPSGDAYMMRWIVHDWEDEKASLILKNCHQAMLEHGKLLLVESIISPGNEPSPAKFIDLIMLLATGGRERTEAEYRSLLRSTGFELTRVIPTGSMVSIRHGFCLCLLGKVMAVHRFCLLFPNPSRVLEIANQFLLFGIKCKMNRRTFTTTLAAGGAIALLGLAHKVQAQTRIAIRNVVLVHGAYADGSCWSEVIRHLQQAGLKVTAVQNPLTSLADDVAATRRILALQDGPTVLVGHSWAGTVISEAGIDSKVAALVYVAARAPDAGEDYKALAAKFPTPPANAGLVRAGGFAQLSEEAFLRDFAGGVEPAEARVLYAVQGRIADTLFASKTTVAAWRSKPSWYAVSTQDRTTAPELERFLAQRMQAKTIEVQSGHLSMITHPQEIVRLILNAAAWSEAHSSNK